MSIDNNNNMFNSKLSVYIPRITMEWAEQAKIAHVFHTNELGVVERVDLVQKQTPDGNMYCEAFVHMDWFDTQSTRNIQERILDLTREARLVHEDPNYWLLLQNRNPMTATEVRLEKRIMELEQRSIQAMNIAINHLNRIMNVETQVNNMNYWNDPALRAWSTNAGQTNNGIAPMWCHPVHESTPTQMPSWYDNPVSATSKTMETYAEDTHDFHNSQFYDEEEDSVGDYYDYDPYDMEILE